MDAIDVEARIHAHLLRGEAMAARALLVAEYEQAVGTLCRGMVRDPRLAEDLAQDAFVRALEGLDYAELAQSFHASEGALRMRMARALETMRDELARIDRDQHRRASRGRARFGRFVLWASLTAGVFLAGIVGVYRLVVMPQQQAAAALAQQLEVMQREAELARAELEAAQAAGASEEELERLREQLGQAQANQQAAETGDVASIMRAPARARAGSRPPASSRGSSSGCMGPLCGLMRSN